MPDLFWLIYIKMNKFEGFVVQGEGTKKKTNSPLVKVPSDVPLLLLLCLFLISCLNQEVYFISFDASQSQENLKGDLYISRLSEQEEFYVV